MMIEIVKSPTCQTIKEPDDNPTPLPESASISTFGNNILPTDDLLNCTFLTEPQEDGQRFRGQVKQKIVEKDQPDEPESPENVKFLISYGNDKADEIIAYNDIIERCNREHTDNATR